MVETETQEVNSVVGNKLVNNSSVKLKIEPTAKWIKLATVLYYTYALNIKEVLELLQLWLGMKFGFNIVGILLN